MQNIKNDCNCEPGPSLVIMARPDYFERETMGQNLSDILDGVAIPMAYKLGYSSVAHLSSQFKQVTGFTPTAFKKLKAHNRKPLDEVGK